MLFGSLAPLVARGSDAASDGEAVVSSPALAAPATAAQEPKSNPGRRVADPTPAPRAGFDAGLEQRLREYEIRLAAHRRALLERESELEAANKRITELGQSVKSKTARSPANRDQERRTPPPASPSPFPAPTSSPTPSPPPVAAHDSDETLVSALQHELDVERENRATLEQEIQRILSEARPSEQLQTVTQSLDGARAHLLLLNQRLAEEQRARESLEIALERVRESAGVAPGADWLERFDATMRERRAQSERLQEDLHDAHEAIVQLKAKLEAQERRPPEVGSSQETQALEAEVAKLREALRSAEQINADLRTQAELAGRLAEMLYGQGR